MAESRRIRVLHWGLALTCLGVGITVGLRLIPTLLGELVGSAAEVRGRTLPGPDRAVLADLPLPVRVQPGAEIIAEWQVINAGHGVWTPGEYRFRPGAANLPIIPMPRSVGPGQAVRIQVRLAVLSEHVGATLRWALLGPRGPVAGGELDLTALPMPGLPAAGE